MRVSGEWSGLLSGDLVGWMVVGERLAAGVKGTRGMFGC